jgi:hypothetical protein
MNNGHPTESGDVEHVVSLEAPVIEEPAFNEQSNSMGEDRWLR